jgi:hypothetical protein
MMYLPIRVHELLPVKLAQALTIHLNFKIDILVDLQLPIELVIFHVGELLTNSTLRLE